MDNRIFYSILERVGGHGTYQTLSLAIWSVIILVAGSSSFFNAFLFYQDEYVCEGSVSDCHAFVCSLPQQQRAAYLNSDFTSFVSKFGDYRCEGSEELNRVQSFIYIGGILGVISGAFLNQIMPKKKLMVLTVLANLAGITLAIFGPTLFISSIGLFINFAAKCVQMEIIICFITQAVAEEIRGKHTIIIYMMFAIGVTLNGFFFKIIKSWQWVLFIYDILPLLFALFSLIFFIEETPFDLIINYTPEESLRALQKIATLNNKNDHNLSLEEISNIKDQYLENEKKTHDYVISILDLFRYESLRTVSILSIILHFLTSFQFNAPELALSQYSLSIYLNGILIGLSQVLACIYCYFIVDLYERKKVIYITEAISICISVPIVVFFSCSQISKCSMEMQIIQSVGLFLFRFSITIAYNFFYMIQYEVFPNQIRALGLQTTAVASYTAVMIVPQIMQASEKLGVSIIFAFAISCILVVLCVLKMPETFGVPPPEMIEQLKYEHHNLNENLPPKIKNY